ncbi:MAG: PorV/PorQ family protein [Elusimicrobia bacterium]|nr:PorV/PorQ family protein [Elusimicrobiota bacterium]
MKKLFKLLLSIAIIFNLTFPGFAFDLGFAKEDGGKAGAFLSYGAGVRSLAMGRAYTAVSNDASAVYSNPAGLMQLQREQITLLHSILWEDTNYNFVSYAKPLEDSAIGIGLVNLSSTNFDKRDQFNYPIGSADLSENALLLSYAKIYKGILVGTTVKAVQQKIDNYSGTGFGVDAGALYALTDRLWFGANLQNIIPPMIKLNTDTDQYPITLNLGASCDISEKVLLSSDFVFTAGRNPKLRIGAEYTPLKMFSIRAGINETEVTAGFGITWKELEIGYAFSYHDALAGYTDLGSSHRFGITYNFGKPCFNKK